MTDNIFSKIISFFSHNNFDEEGEQAYWNWLVKDEKAAEKDEALQDLWAEASRKKSEFVTRRAFSRFQRNQGIASRRTVYVWQTAAAVLAALLVTAVTVNVPQNRQQIDYIQSYVPTADIEQVTLPDGTQVSLNSHSTLFYPEKFTGKDRSVYLIGEATFKVNPDKKHPFIVKSTDFQVTALGTEFNVSAYSDSPEIAATLISGSVLVECNELTDNAVLKPGQQFSYDKTEKTSSITVADVADVTAWQRGELVFRETTIQEIISILERKYPYSFEYRLKDLKDDRYSFRFKDKASFEDIIDIITNVAGNLTYEINGDNCVLRAK